MEASLAITLQIVIVVIAGISAQVLAEYLKLPGIVLLLPFGIVLGPDALGLVHPNMLGVGLEVIVALLVAVILFEGGLNLDLRELGKVSGSLRNLVTIGTLVTLIGGGIAAHWLSEFPWPIAFLYAALVVVTGPTVIGPLLKHINVDRQVGVLLEGEGVLIDPVGAILAVLVLDVILNGDTVPLEIISGLIIRLGIGGGIGAVGGWLMGFILKRLNSLSEDLKNLLVLAGVWGLFGLAQTIRSEAGLMTTVMAGIVLRASSLPEERLLRRFKGALTTLAVSVLFILLAADLSIASVFVLGWGSLFTVLVLMFVVRPLNVWICTWNSQLSWRQKIFLCWISPRGIVSASVASLFAILLTERGFNGGDAIKALVFLTIILTIAVQGPTAGWLADMLQITSSKATGVVIVGSNPLSRLVARLFQERGEAVVMIDTDADACREAEKENLRVFLSSGLDEDVLDEAGLSSAGTFLAMTNNGEVNLVVAQRTVEEFQPPRVLAVFPKNPQPGTAAKKSKTQAKNSKIQQAFISDFPIKIWNQYLANGNVKLGTTVLKEKGLAFQQAHLRALIRAGELIPLVMEREKRFQIVPAEDDWQQGDQIIYLLHDPRPQLLKRLSGASQSTRLALEKLAEVEEVAIPPAVPETSREGLQERDLEPQAELQT